MASSMRSFCLLAVCAAITLSFLIGSTSDVVHLSFSHGFQIHHVDIENNINRSSLDKTSVLIWLSIYAHLMKSVDQEAACRLEDTVFEKSGRRNETRGQCMTHDPLI